MAGSSNDSGSSTSLPPVHCDPITDNLYHYIINRPQYHGPSDEFNQKTLVIIFGWINSKPSNIKPYREFYHARGFDVLYIQISVSMFVWPKNAFAFSKSLNNLLEQNFSHYQSYILHSFSIGAYVLAVCFEVAANDPAMNNITRKAVGYIWDSLTLGSLSKMISGISTGLTSSLVLQTLIKSLCYLYFGLTKRCTVDSHTMTVQLFKTSVPDVPCVLFGSADDAMSSVKSLTSLVDGWKRYVRSVTYKIWDTSKHTAHLKYHYDEYLDILANFLDYVRKQPVPNSNDDTNRSQRKSKL